ncbi:four helix bundle protein [Saccharicrinis sp. FJH2]|uniref:four helix bundle protein n=1 Tax=Saccharicrinis sp. FJH65 TaxID=3344659 RepID=UPI0035F365D3
MHNFKELKIWQKSKELVVEIYRLTQNFPSSEQFGIISQIQQAAVSIPSNIAEGSGRNSKKDFIRFLDIAKSSSFELETQIIIATDLGYINNEVSANIIKTINEIQKMIFGFQKSLDS